MKRRELKLLLLLLLFSLFYNYINCSDIFFTILTTITIFSIPILPYYLGYNKQADKFQLELDYLNNNIKEIQDDCYQNMENIQEFLTIINNLNNNSSKYNLKLKEYIESRIGKGNQL